LKPPAQSPVSRPLPPSSPTHPSTSASLTAQAPFPTSPSASSSASPTSPPQQGKHTNPAFGTIVRVLCGRTRSKG
jgi:hypothetical protein